jgi:raffinose/stachyose/melibiose transport system permease protein
VKKNLYLLMALPAFLIYTMFVAYPFVSSIVLSLFDWPGIGPKRFIGLENYATILTGFMKPEFVRSVTHNAVFFVWSWALAILPGLAFAFLLFAGLKGTNVLKVVFFFPNVLAVVVVGFLFSLLLNPQWGPINNLLRAVGLKAWAKPWLGEIKYAFPAIIAVTAWRGLGFYILVFLAAMMGISKDEIEAARLDGASEWRIGRSVIIPHLLPTVVTLSILKFIWVFNIFDIVYAMEGSQGGPVGSTDVLGTLFYRIAFGGLGSTQVGMGLGAAVVTVIFAIVFPVSVLYVFILDRRMEGRID